MCPETGSGSGQTPSLEQMARPGARPEGIRPAVLQHPGLQKTEEICRPRNACHAMTASNRALLDIIKFVRRDRAVEIRRSKEVAPGFGRPRAVHLGGQDVGVAGQADTAPRTFKPVGKKWIRREGIP